MLFTNVMVKTASLLFSPKMFQNYFNFTYIPYSAIMTGVPGYY